MSNYILDIKWEESLIRAETVKMEAMIAILPRLAKAMANIPAENVRYCYCCALAQVIVNVKTRDDFAHIRALYAGVWKKCIREEAEGEVAVDYTALVSGVLIVANVSELPPSCKIVEEEVPECVVPAHIKRRVVCNEGVEK